MVAMNHKPQVLVVEDEEQTLNDYLWNLHSDAYELIGASAVDQALAYLEQYAFDVVVVDLLLPDSVEQGMQVIAKAQTLDATIAVIVVTSMPSASIASRAFRQFGAWDFMSKPLDFVDCRRKLLKAIRERRYRLRTIETAEQGGFAPIHSPYVSGSPLGTGNLMFYGQDEIFEFICNNIGEQPNHNHFLLFGPRRIGKTSILQQLPKRLKSERFLEAYVDCQALGIDKGMQAFFLQLAYRIRRGLGKQGLDTSTLPMPRTGVFDSTAVEFTGRFLQRVFKVLGQRSLVLCLDEFEELIDKVRRKRLDASVFDFLHGIMMEEKRIIFVIAGTRRLLSVDNFYHQSAAKIVELALPREVGPLSPELTCRLIQEPVDYSGMFYQGDAITAIQRATGGYPYLVQLLCGSLVNIRNEQRRNEITLEDVETAISALVESPQLGFFWESLSRYQKITLAAVAELWHHGNVVTVPRLETELLYTNVNLIDWPLSVSEVLRQLSLEGLLREHIHIRRISTYTLTFELSGKWISRHEPLERIARE